jgi:hypothetical protein
MSLAPLSKYKLQWLVLLTVFEEKYEMLIAVHPEAKMEIDLVVATLVKISQLLSNSSEANVSGEKLEQLTHHAQTEMEFLHNHMDGKEMYTALLCMFSLVHKEMRDSLQANDMEANQEAAMQPEHLDLAQLLKHKRELRKLWQHSRDTKVKTDLNRVSKTIRKMIHGMRTSTMGNEDTEVGCHTPSNMA